MTSESVERLRREGQAFVEELGREYYLSGAGLKPTAELQPIYRRYEWVAGHDALAMMREELQRSAPGTEEHRQARMLTEWLFELQSSRELAALEEREIAWENSTIVELTDGRQMEYQSVAIAMGQTRDRAERLAMEKARQVAVSSGLSPLRRERFEQEHRIVAGLGLANGYNQAFEALSGVDLSVIAGQCEALLDDTQAMWDDTFPRFVRKILHIEPGDAVRADALALFRGHEFDDQFPLSSMEWEIRRQMREMGLDPIAGGRVVYDTEDRPSKRSRAFCAQARVPDEVYLVLRPHGGQGDWSTFLHELGHALHFANMDASLPFEYRWLGDNSITEGCAMLFDHLMFDPGWLKRYTPLSTTKLDAFLRAGAFFELHMIRRYAAKLLYEIELHGGERSDADLQRLYVDRLTRATSFRYSEADAYIDIDPRFYSTRYLRAWQLQALVTETLRERFDADWWRNPRAGPWIAGEIYAGGQRELAPEQAKRVSGKELGFAPLVRAIERELA